MTRLRRLSVAPRATFALLAVLLLPAAASAQQTLSSTGGVVSAAHPLAARAGAEMLERGGNAVDAAVATAFALAVVEPSMSGLGGRAQIIVHLPGGEIHGIDATTQAPASYDPDTAPQASYGYATVGVPGVPAGLIRAHEEFGRLSRATVMEPAIRLASEGFALLPGEARRHASARDQLAEFEGSTRHFLRPDGSAHRAGDRIVQSELAEVLREIAARGHDGFYRGWVAERMAADLQANGAPVTLESLAEYRAEVSEIVRGSYRGVEMAGLWIPSYGAITILALHLLETVDLEGASEAEWAAAIAEALRVAYLERPNQDGPEDARRLTDPGFAAERAAALRLPGRAGAPGAAGARVVPAGPVGPLAGTRPSSRPRAEPAPIEDGHTTHLSTADAEGGMVALTQSLGPNMGSKVATPGLGFLYAATTGGYLGRMEGGTRAQSHISPFLLLRDGEPWVALGAAGGGRIPTAIVAAVSRMVDGGMRVDEALRAPRVVPVTGSAFVEGDPDARPEVDLEIVAGVGFTDAEVAEFESLGFTARRTTRDGAFGRIHAVQRDASGAWIGAADPDWEGAAAGPEGRRFDLVLQGGRVLDGTGNPWFTADVGIAGDRIVAIGDLSGAEAGEVLDVSGHLVTPGFIDTHSHAAGGLVDPELSRAHPLVAQGITTVFVNPDGGGTDDVVAQRAELLEHGLGVNVARFVPHGRVRARVMGSEDRAPTDDEMERMRAIVREGMEDGAFGLSSGTFYVPGVYADNSELVELARVVAEYGGAYQSHVRDESDYSIGVLAALEEVIEVGRHAGIPAVHTHIKALGPNVWGFGAAIVHRVEQARAEGVEVYADQYPYPASATGLSAALLPPWSMAGGNDSLQARFDRPEAMARIRESMVENLARRGGADRIQFRTVRSDPSLEGRLLSDIAAEWGLDPIDAAVRMLRTDRPGIVSFNMDEDDIATLMVQPWMMTASDGGLVAMGAGVPHPRNYGAFTRKLEEWVARRGVVELEAAIRSMTSLPAQVFRMEDRGTVAPGMRADLAVFRLEDLREHATFTEPHQLSEGMAYVLVNGVPVVREGRFTDALPGRILELRGGRGASR